VAAQVLERVGDTLRERGAGSVAVRLADGRRRAQLSVITSLALV
jgi:hypothetical protein